MSELAHKTQKKLQIGLGEAIQRILKLEQRLLNGFHSEHDMEERTMLLDALNLTMLDLGFDCDTTDNIPTTVEIFAKSAETSCCRIVPADTSRRAPTPAPTVSATPSETPQMSIATAVAMVSPTFKIVQGQAPAAPKIVPKGNSRR